jgi:hypothetical protein
MRKCCLSFIWNKTTATKWLHYFPSERATLCQHQDVLCLLQDWDYKFLHFLFIISAVSETRRLLSRDESTDKIDKLIFWWEKCEELECITLSRAHVNLCSFIQCISFMCISVTSLPKREAAEIKYEYSGVKC